MVGRMITDPQKIRRGDPGRPEICNVFSYEKLFGTPAERVEEIDRTCRSGELGCREHKDEIDGADRRVPAPVPRAPRAGARRPRPSWSGCSSGAPSAHARSPSRSWSAPRRRWACERTVAAATAGTLATVCRRTAWSVDLDVFEGPFDLLITLILNEEIDLLEVHLAEIVLAYIERLEARGELDLEAATEFLVLIAALLELKSRLMLPGEEMDGLDLEPQEAVEELLARLLEYRRYRGAAEACTSGWPPSRATATASAPLPPELRRVTLDAAGQVYEPARSPRRSRRCCARRRRSTRATCTGSRSRSSAGSRTCASCSAPRRAFSFDEAVEGEDRMTQAVTLFALLELYKSGELVWKQTRDLRTDRDHGDGGGSVNPHSPDRLAALLFCSSAAGAAGRAGEALECGEPELDAGARASCARSFAPGRLGIVLREVAGGLTLASDPEAGRRRAAPAREAAHAAALAGAGRVPRDRRPTCAGRRARRSRASAASTPTRRCRRSRSAA